mmetsp:Transcript_117876/g.328343  ORF Transcript_117876/g.328343 Transcript_117876/m.328343 type:complete len:357 (+) Transcript_117876:884-1954(+)
MMTLCGIRFVSTKSTNSAKFVSLTWNALLTSDTFCRSSSTVVPLAFSDSCQRPMSHTSPPLTAWQDSSPSQMTSRGAPRSAKSMRFISQTARTSMFKRFTSIMAGMLRLRLPERLNWASCCMSCVPTLPLPMIPTAIVMSESVKPAWAARSPRDRSSREMTADMLRSDEPCAMAITLTWALPNELKKRPPMPGLLFMPSPMTAMMLTWLFVNTRISGSLANSNAKACLMLLRAGASSFSSTATVIECSEEPWEVRITLTPAVPRASIILLATPGVPRKEAPARVTRHTFSMDVIAFTGKFSSSSSSSWSGHRRKSSPRPYTRVPGCEGLKTLRTSTGILFSMQGTIAEGCSTWPPK